MNVRSVLRRHPAATTTATIGSLCLASLAGIGAAAPGTSALAVHSASAWGTVQEVPGIATLNLGGDASVTAVSCVSAGNCSAGGHYASSHVSTGAPPLQAYVVTETNGHWGTAKEVPGIGTLNKFGDADITTVSCASPGNCGAGGFYASGAFAQHQPDLQAFVVNETNGTWGTAHEVSGTSVLNHGGNAQVTSISCVSPGNCGAGGFYASRVDPSNGVYTLQAFVLDERNGAWGSAREVPGTAALNKGGSAGINSVSCSSSGNCSAGGFYASSVSDAIPTTQAMVVTERNGSWGSAQEVPGTAGLNTGTGAFATVNSVSCASAGNCSAGGEYLGGNNATEAFVVSQVSGTWRTAQEVPGIGTLNRRGLAQVETVSCRSAGNCDAGGSYQDASFVSQAFLVTQSRGTWGTAHEVPGTAAISHGGADVPAISCDAAGNCGAGGWYQGNGNDRHAFVDTKRNGVWATAARVPGALFGSGGSQTQSLSCAPTGYCAVGGTYTKVHGMAEAFVDNATLP